MVSLLLNYLISLSLISLSLSLSLSFKRPQERGVHLHGLRSRPTLQIQKETYLSLGWKSVEALDMNTVSDIYLDRNEIARYEYMYI